jgi:hypothetical protein
MPITEPFAVMLAAGESGGNLSLNGIESPGDMWMFVTTDVIPRTYIPGMELGLY